MVEHIPERPMLASNVSLVGQMQDTGFTDRQWLIQRDGRFIQVTELLYRLAESLNGERTLEQIAARLTETTEWAVSTDQVQTLLDRKFAPLGLLAAADGDTAVRRLQRRSALQINLQRKVIGPAIINPVAGALQFLFIPIIAIPVLLAATLATGWLFFVHGITDSVRLALFTPGGLLAVLAGVIASGVVHEFGHAAALRYSGGRARGMGVGFYLVYPTFYTDTSDAYRLDRWGRLRTDLGGIYFHLIFNLALMTLYVISGQEILLAIVLVITGDIFYQLLPYLRLDGYWALADLMGIPDPLSQISPFLRSTMSMSALTEGNTLPPLKRWAKVAFIIYISLALPVLALLFGLIVINFPRAITFAGSALQYQLSVLAMLWQTGTLVEIAAVAMQIVLLALSLLGAIYLFYSIGRPLFTGLWNWGKRSLAHAVTSVLAAAAIAAVLALLWIPQFTFAGRPMPTGVEQFPVTEQRHVDSPVIYAQTPPVGGNHAPIWQNCGFYAQAIGSVYAVHSMEHGAVWITYLPELAPNEVEQLRQLAHRESYVIASPYPDLPAPVVASAWGYQLRLDSADDPRLEQFVRTFELGPQAPERQGPCTGGVGKPLP